MRSALTIDDFVGLKHYSYILQTPSFGTPSITLIFLTLEVFIPVSMGLMLAVLTAELSKGRVIYRSLLFLPAIFSDVMITYVWKWIYHPFAGILNQALAAADLDFLTMPWLGGRCGDRPFSGLCGLCLGLIWLLDGDLSGRSARHRSRNLRCGPGGWSQLLVKIVLDYHPHAPRGLHLCHHLAYLDSYGCIQRDFHPDRRRPLLCDRRDRGLYLLLDRQL